MRARITEQTVLFLSVIKWVVLATAAGAIVGLATGGFLKLLNLTIVTSQQFPYTFLLLPLAFLGSSLLVEYLAPDARGHGTEKVIEAIHRRSGKIEAPVIPVKLAATILTLAIGGSAGKEGPCAQIGGGLSSLFADLLRFDDHDRKKLVVCGISAGFAAVFGTPIAGSIFGVEVLFVGSILYDVLLPSFIAGVTSYQLASSLGVTYFHQPIAFAPVFSESFMIKVVLAGVFFGLCAMFLIEMLKVGERLAEKIKVWVPFKGVIGGAALVVLTLIFSTRYLGLGLTTIESCLRGNPDHWYGFIIKPIFTSITLSFGGSGGIVTPIFFVGATAGATLALLFGLNISTFSAIGLVSVLAGAANTPIAASILAVEMFGPAIAPYATIACVISFLMTGHRSVYPSQILSIGKSASIEVELGKEIDDAEIAYKPRERGLVPTALKLMRMIEERVRKHD